MLLGSLLLAWRRWVGLGTRWSDFATFARLDFLLESGSFLLDLAEAVLQGVVGGAEVQRSLLQIDLDSISRAPSNDIKQAHLDPSSNHGGDDTLPGRLRVPVDFAVGHCVGCAVVDSVKKCCESRS